MERIYKVDADSLVRSIENRANPFEGEQALALRDKWFLENDLGTLQISREVRAILEAARVPPQLLRRVSASALMSGYLSRAR